MSTEGFKRINYFTGLFTEAEDWEAAQKYHLEKRKLQNKTLFTPGIVYGLEVTAGEDATTVQIKSGYAIDGEGHDIFLPRSKVLKLPKKRLSPKWYVAIQYDELEHKDDWREDKENPGHRGYAFIREIPKVGFVKDCPNNTIVLELARIDLSEDADKVNDASNPMAPVPGEIDTRFVQNAYAPRPRVRFQDFFEVIKRGGGLLPTRNTLRVGIEDKLKKESGSQYYFVSAHPDEDEEKHKEQLQFTWKIESELNKDGTIQYWVTFENLSKESFRIGYEVLKLVLSGERVLSGK